MYNIIIIYYIAEGKLIICTSKQGYIFKFLHFCICMEQYNNHGKFFIMLCIQFELKFLVKSEHFLE